MKYGLPDQIIDKINWKSDEVGTNSYHVSPSCKDQDYYEWEYSSLSKVSSED